MKKTMWASCREGLRFKTPGESYASIIQFFAPEVVTAFVTCALIPLIDGRFIAQISHTEAYATLSVTNSLMHCIMKLADGISVGTMVLCGIAHGKEDAAAVGRSWGTALTLAIVIGAAFALVLGLFPESIFYCLRTPCELLEYGIPFLRLRAVSVFLMFIFFCFMGLLRGVKRNAIATQCVIVGTLTFIVSDYLFIFGKCGFPQLGFAGSAAASIVQYSAMIIIAFKYMRSDVQLRSYASQLRWSSWHAVQRLFTLSLPVMLDKGLLSVGKIFLLWCIAPMGKVAMSSFGAIRDLEMFMFVPAIAYAHVITGLVSNEVGAGDIIGIKYTIKKVLLLALLSAAIILAGGWWYADYLINFFDQQHRFREFAIPAFRIISLLAICDVIQVVLSAALRGCAQTKVVLRVRLLTLLLFCFPVAYAASWFPFQSDFVRFITIYGSFYINNGLMALWYIAWLRSDRWGYAPV